MEKEFTTQPENQGQRLDKFLAEVLADITRSQIQKLVKEGLVSVNHKPAKVHHFLKTGDIITINEEQSDTKSITNSLPAYQPISLLPKVIFENNDYLVLEKPCGLLVHATEKNETDTLVDWLLKKYPEMEKVGENKYRAGILHRLDKDVSGVMVVAKNDRAFEHLKQQFKDRKVKKEYLALVYGRLPQETGEIDLPIGRGREGQFVAHPKSGQEKFQADDRLAKTKYQLLEQIKDYSFLLVQILTGRTHQIRVHFSAIGHPIVGDQIYKPKKQFLHLFSQRIKVVDPGRIFLHSTRLGFIDLNGQWVEFESPLPSTLTDFINEKKQR
jgi:23S rRNA pseudouridine1911/1915/1917 synthase